MRILLVEDSPFDSGNIERSLRATKEFDYELTKCDRLDAALALLRSNSFNLVILDLELPDSSGLESYGRVTEIAPDVPIVILTSTDDAELATQALRRGAQDYLVKGEFLGPMMIRFLKYATERHRVRLEFSKQAWQLRHLLERVPAIVWTMDAQLRFTSSIGAGLARLNLHPDEVVGRTLEEYLGNSEEKSRAVQAHLQALAGRSIQYEAFWRGRFYEVQLAPLRRADHEQIIGVIGVALDITDRRQLDQEFIFARRVQQSLLPATQPSILGFDIYGASFPARATCGDWFDFLTLSDSSLGIVVGDVAGKGFGPAILSAAIAAYLEVLATSACDVSRILEMCNQLVCKHGSEQNFATLTLTKIHAASRHLSFASAGEQAVLISSQGNVKQILNACGPPVGIGQSLPFTAATEFEMQPGDILLLVTDGFHEAHTPPGELFGRKRMIRSVADHRTESARDILLALVRDASDFVGRQLQSDDMTGVIVKALE